ncbi:DUF3833 domain-containing protein [Cupriavidus basilensis]
MRRATPQWRSQYDATSAFPAWCTGALGVGAGCCVPSSRWRPAPARIFPDDAAAAASAGCAAFFTGKTEAWGMFQKRGGEVVKRFTVAIEGSQQGNGFVLDGQHFNYSDGTTERRTWTLARQLDGTWRGRAGDVVGEAIGHSAGNALNWRYTLRLPVGNTTYDVQFDDWMYLVDAHTMINRASVSKFGFEVGQVTVFFSRPR